MLVLHGLRWRLQRNGDAAREDRCEHRIAEGRGQKNVGTHGRLFQGFQKSIRRLRLEAVGIVDHGDLVHAREGLHVQGLLKFANLLGDDAAGFRFRRGFVEIGMGGDILGTRSKDGGREMRRKPLATGSRRSRQKVGVCKPPGCAGLDQSLKCSLFRKGHGAWNLAKMTASVESNSAPFPASGAIWKLLARGIGCSPCERRCRDRSHRGWRHRRGSSGYSYSARRLALIPPKRSRR